MKRRREREPEWAPGTDIFLTEPIEPVPADTVIEPPSALAPAGVREMTELALAQQCGQGFHAWTPWVCVGAFWVIRCARCGHEERTSA